jgi:hypothetical protein
MAQLHRSSRSQRSLAGRFCPLIALAAFALGSIAACGGSDPGQASPESASPSETPTSTPAMSESPGLSVSPASATFYADLDGAATTQELAHRMPLALMIDDHPAARPQSGLSAASIVYQASVNGGVLRYMAIYQEGDSTAAGPVRSARPFFARWASEYHAVFAHWGASPLDLRSVIPGLGTLGALHDMDGLENASRAFHRVTTRPVPHNVYTDTAALRQAAAALGYPTTIDAGLATRPFVDDAPLSDRPASASIVLPYRAATITYTYDRATNTYPRSVGGVAQIDQANGLRIAPKSVVVLFQQYYIDQSKDNYLEPVITDQGSGQALVFQDGKTLAATWKKTSQTSLTRLYDAAGSEIALVRGQIFIQSVPTTTKVTYS